jgi:hypothetical protein
MSVDVRYALNAICPYFTMFPLEYPMRMLDGPRVEGYKAPLVADPFCGRGTTIFAARLRGLRAFGADVAPVAVAIARAKLANTTLEAVIDLYDTLIETPRRVPVPVGEFWSWAFRPEVLRTLCQLRSGLATKRSDAATLLRAVILGGLHGPRAKTANGASYFSNQMPRTFAAKPDYAVRFWRRERRKPPKVDVRAIIEKRTRRVLAHAIRRPLSSPIDVLCADSRSAAAYERLEGKITHVVTSPPYYGLRTYSQDQWLRHWFLGGSHTVDYSVVPGLDHGSPDTFSQSLARVWDQIGSRAAEGIQLCIRFGGIRSRHTSAEDILRHSFSESDCPWRIVTRHRASSASDGRRQALQMQTKHDPIEESDYVVRLC